MFFAPPERPSLLASASTTGRPFRRWALAAMVTAPSVMPYEVEAVVSMVSAEGTYTGAGQFTINGCSTVILKIVMEVELLVPSYGYCAIPPCQNYSQEVCAGFFELPIYPQ